MHWHRNIPASVILSFSWAKREKEFSSGSALQATVPVYWLKCPLSKLTSFGTLHRACPEKWDIYGHVMRGAERDTFVYFCLEIADHSSITRHQRDLYRMYQVSCRTVGRLGIGFLPVICSRCERQSTKSAVLLFHILIDTTQTKRTQRWIHDVHHPSRASSHSWMKLSQLKDCTRNMSDGASCWVASWLGIYLSSEHTAKELVSAMSLRRESPCLGSIVPLSR